MRTANRVLLPLREFACASEADLYEGVHALAWTDWLTPEMTQTLVVCIIAELLLFFYLLAQRVRLEALRDDLVAIRRTLSAR